MAHLGARRVGSGWRLCEGDLEAGGWGWEGSPAGSVPRRPEEATGGDLKRQRGPSGCYRDPLIVNGSPRCATGGLRVAFVRGGPGGRRRGVGRLTGRQCPKTTRGGHRWRSEAAERSVGMLSIPSDSKRFAVARDGSAPAGFVRGGSGGLRRGGWEGSPVVSVPRRPEEATGGDPRRQRGPSGCYRYPLIVNGSPRRATGRLRVAFVRGGSGSRRRGVGRLTGRQGPKTTRGGYRWRSEAAERSVGMLSIPPDSKRLALARDGSAPGGVYARGIWKPAAGGGKAHRPAGPQDDPRRLQVEI